MSTPQIFGRVPGYGADYDRVTGGWCVVDWLTDKPIPGRYDTFNEAHDKALALTRAVYPKSVWG